MENVITNYSVKDRKTLYNSFSKIEELTISDGEKETKRDVG